MDRDTTELHSRRGHKERFLPRRPDLAQAAYEQVIERRRAETQRKKKEREEKWRQKRVNRMHNAIESFVKTGELPQTLTIKSEQKDKFEEQVVVEKLKVDWSRGERIVAVKPGTSLSRNPQEALKQLEGQMYFDEKGKRVTGVTGFRFESHACGLKKMADSFGLSGFAWDAFVDSNTFDKENGQDWQSVMQNAKNVVILIGGWMSETPVWLDIPAKIAKENPGTVCIVLNNLGFGRANFDDWDFARKSGAFTVDGVALFQGMFEKALRTGKKNVVKIGHSMMGKMILDLPDKMLTSKRRAHIAVCPAEADAYYQALEKAMKVSGGAVRIGRQILGEELTQEIAGYPAAALIEILTGKAYRRIKRTHVQVAKMANLDEASAYVMKHLHETQRQFLKRRKKWPAKARLKVLGGEKDVLVDTQTVFQDLRDHGVLEENLYLVKGGGHYAIGEGDEQHEISLAAKMQLIKWVGEFLN